ncbi:AzlC family ABC transporter permease [Corynebacterium ammoniagenes]|uniref:AzlC family ABC transporter permease n=1 Tax=Corynebacterium ammoniagenes TaxID=1697 RepID=UPI001459ABB0|nr:AzlC family ABC transporter permease [Corynebacterium ammoniagenes]NMF32773.1 AzlC family ABC transporter permease [Corynebacterium ammoniagenes]
MHVEEIKKGIKDSWAVGIGLVPLGLAFGLLMVQTGFDWWWTPIFSIVVYAGSMEFLAIPMVLQGTSVAASVITGFMVNFRHLFYGLTFPRHRVHSAAGKMYSTYALTDESYAIVSSMPRDVQLSGPRIVAIQLLCQSSWVAGGVVGALAGQVIPRNVEGLEFALVALFVVLTMDSFKNNPDYSLPLTAVVFGIIAAIIFPNQILMVALTAYLAVLLLRFYSPQIDEKLEWRRGSKNA